MCVSGCDSTNSIPWAQLTITLLASNWSSEKQTLANTAAGARGVSCSLQMGKQVPKCPFFNYKVNCLPKLMMLKRIARLRNPEKWWCVIFQLKIACWKRRPRAIYDIVMSTLGGEYSGPSQCSNPRYSKGDSQSTQSVATRSIRGQCPPNCVVPTRKFCFQHITKTKFFHPNNCPFKTKPGYGPGPT